MASDQIPWKIETHDSLVLPASAGETQCYRVKNGNVEFQPSTSSRWRRLAPTDVLQHVELRTEVAEWLQRRTAGQVLEHA
jgi:hypothetical protein